MALRGASGKLSMQFHFQAVGSGPFRPGDRPLRGRLLGDDHPARGLRIGEEDQVQFGKI